MTDQPDALRLADALEYASGNMRSVAHQAAAELRRLHEENERLREQLRCDAENMEKGMGKSMQRLCARSIRETLRGEYD